jgi:hypothetical protein
MGKNQLRATIRELEAPTLGDRANSPLKPKDGLNGAPGKKVSAPEIEIFWWSFCSNCDTLALASDDSLSF